MTAAASDFGDGLLQGLCAQLRAMHLRADISVDSLCGERDVRLEVRHDEERDEDGDVRVELLAPDPPTWSSHTWDAVRVERGHRRVWRGPDRSCSMSEVMGFVQAVLYLGTGQLAQLYVDLG